MDLKKAFFKRPWIIIALTVILTGLFGSFIMTLVIDNSIRQFMPQKDESYKRLNDTEDVFGSMLVIGVSVADNKGDILTPENIEVIRKITDRCIEVNDVEEVDSLTHIDYVCNHDGAISATQLIPEEYTGSAQDIAELKSKLYGWEDMYNRVIISDDDSATQMQISIKTWSAEDRANARKIAKENGTKVVTDADRQQGILNQIRTIVAEETADHPNLSFKVYGDPVVTEQSRKFMLSDLIKLIPLVTIVVLLSLYFSFKTVDGTLLPLINVLVSTIITVGIMAVTGRAFTLVSSVIPVALIAVGSAYGIHVLTHYYVELTNQSGVEFTKETYEAAIYHGLREVFKPVLLSGLTTVIGFISLVTSPIEPLHDFAIFTAIGVALSLILSLTFVPAMLFAKSYKKINEKFEKQNKKINEIADEVVKYKKIHEIKRRIQQMTGRVSTQSSGTSYNIYKFFCGSKPRMIIFSLVIVVFSVIGLSLLKIDTSLVGYFPAKTQMRQDIDYVNENFAGSNSVYFTISGQNPGDIKNPEILKAVDDMQNYLAEKYDNIGKIVSFTTFIKRINQVWFAPGSSVEAADTSVAADTSDFDFDAGFDFGEDDFSFDDEFSFDEEEDSAPAAAPVDWVDPNIEYNRLLNGEVTAFEMIKILNDAYTEAGGQGAHFEDILDVLERKFNYDGMAYYEIPYDPAKYPVATREELAGVVNGYLTLLSGSLDRFLDSDLNPRVMRVTCQLRNFSTIDTGKIINDAKAYAAEHFPEGYTIEATGSGEMEYTMTNLVVSSQVSSLLISLLSVFIIITISFGSGWAGLLGTVPLAFTILLNYMIMGFAGINLDLVTSIIASVAVGVGIDYTIHFLSTYKQERALTDDLEAVTKTTFLKSGHGIITNALAVGLGFMVLCCSKFLVLRYIGILVAIVMFSSSMLAMTIIPGILNIFDPKFIRSKKEN
ncbi:RND family transporter [Treponema sp. C6A8]|uniref:efflux RND transporter permease subunit n=1 Tax=Treponema sp. C6A8 TaxID=1410609 RepID=UPI000489B43A|nr:MMPL family transporter [Treponema sp. C6A8]